MCWVLWNLGKPIIAGSLRPTVSARQRVRSRISSPPLQIPARRYHSAPTSVSVNSAVLNGNVTPNGLATNAWFEWGTDAGLSGYSTTASQPVGSGTISQLVTAPLTGLSPGAPCYYRVAASNGTGVSRGAIVSFSPGAAPSVPRWRPRRFPAQMRFSTAT